MNNPPTADPKIGSPSVTPFRLFLRRIVVQLLRLRVWLTERGPGNLWESNYFWAAIVGLCGAFSSVAFRESLNQMQLFLLHYNGPLENAATTLPWWGRLLMPAAGGLIAGSILLFGQKWSTAGKSADFMEAVVLGNGVIRVRATIVKSLSSLVTISSGGSIGREGPMVQLASMLGSLLGRLGKFSPARLRLFVACGAAAGIACAYNAPLTGAFFVAEIVLGSIAMESIGPLIVSSVVATVIASQFLGAQPDLSHASLWNGAQLASRCACGARCRGRALRPTLFAFVAGRRDPVLADASSRFAQARPGRFDRRGDLDLGTGRLGQRLRRGRIGAEQPLDLEGPDNDPRFKGARHRGHDRQRRGGRCFYADPFLWRGAGRTLRRSGEGFFPSYANLGEQLRGDRDGLFSRGDDPRADHVDLDHFRDDARRRDHHAVDARLRRGLLRRARSKSRIGLQPPVARGAVLMPRRRSFFSMCAI